MKDIINFINESVSNITYALRWYYYADEKMSWSYQSSLNRAQKFIQKMQKQGMKIYEIYEIPTDNVKEFKVIVKKKGDIEDQLKEICSGYWTKADIEKFLDKK